jgi:probable HAF family extracellular repeat protein
VVREVIDVTKEAPPSPKLSQRPLLRGLLDLRPSLGPERTAVVDEAVAGEPAAARVYSFASADHPGAAQSLIFDSDGTTAVGVFSFDPSSAASPLTAFAFSAGGYQVLPVPSSTASVATGINEGGVIVGAYTDMAGKRHGFVDDGDTFTDVDVPGAGTTQVIGVNAGGQIVGDYFDAADVEHGFVRTEGVVTTIDFPGATGTVAAGINAAGDIVGGSTDAAGSHGFLFRSGVFTPINFPLATSTTRLRHQ